ncbi:NAD(P)-dependent alcohol dehydrogenase [Actinoplanes oblitus]|uniref:NAD(P)-dependent alcohol dehydrogenase n=1 Tax=Actinoplanes oblitus TaxID=3040509 RepID=A0ABY8WKH4_9ACTN|nr:NAD(P)-dependent alcohol dehydrogenase [Actinoplanes oblitus]WIM98374.1 NAD(P)-dependent alcohol dehydrogenase [Actinoplanes oblitus]
MKAIVQDRYGGPERLRWTEVATPEPGHGEVLIRTRAASLNAWDWHFMRGDPYVMRLPGNLTRPRGRIRGRDVAGEIVALGAGVTGFRVGDPVFADLGPAQAAFAEFVSAPQHLVAPKPANLSFAEAAALPLAAGTALGCLRESALAAGQRILINGASGGVGTFAVQIAKSLGAEVTAVCGTRNVELVTGLGADRVIDYRQEDFTKDPGGFDVVLDLVGNRTLPELRRLGGTIALSGGGTSTGGSLLGPFPLVVRAMVTAPWTRQRIFLPAPPPSRATLDTLRELTESGRITPVIDRGYPLHEAADAMRYLETEHARAKVVLTV